MSVIFTARMEIDFSEWTSETDTENDLNWSASAGLAGSAGGAALLIDNTTLMYLNKTGLADTSGKARCRFYIDPNTLTMGAGEDFVVLRLANTADDRLCQVYLYYSSGNYKIYHQITNDAGSNVDATGAATITDAPHYVEIYLQRASSNVASDGSLLLQVDGVDIETISGIDNYDRFVQLGQVHLGAYFGLDAGTSGTFYLDEVVVNNDGSLIGPVVTTSIPVIMNQYRQRK